MATRPTTIVLSITIIFIVCNLIGLSFFYSYVPASRAIFASSLQQQPPSSSAIDPTAAQFSDDPVIATFLSQIAPFKRLLPVVSSKTPQCTHANQSSALRIQNFEGTTKTGPYPNLHVRNTLEASLHLLDVIENALIEGEVCYWLDRWSLLGAYHHAAPFPYSSSIELGIILSDLKKAVTVIVFYSCLAQFYLAPS